MKISIKGLSTLTGDELTFLYKMMVVNGEMPEFVEEPYSSAPEKKPNHYNNSQSNKKPNHYNKKKSKNSDQKKFKPKDKNNPNLYDLDDPLWEKCTDEKFLAFRKIMIKLNE